MIKSDTLEGLRTCFSARPEFAELFRYLGSRKRGSGQLHIDRLLADPDLKDLGTGSGKRRALLEFFRELQRLGVGVLIVGRRGKRTRFKWADDVSMIEVARSASGDPVPTEQTPDSEIPQSKIHSTMATLVPHQFVIRPDTTLRVDLPMDFSPEEAERLAAFIRAIPFPRLGR